MISETAAIWGIVIFSLCGIVYFGVVGSLARMFDKNKLADRPEKKSNYYDEDE